VVEVTLKITASEKLQGGPKNGYPVLFLG